MPPDTACAGVGGEAPAVPPASGRGWRVAAFARDRAASTAVFLLLVAGAALLAPPLSPYDPAAADNLLRYASPGTAGHLLGTDAQGRDMLSRLLWGGRTTALVGESGSGKTVTALSVRVAGGTVRYLGRDLLALTERQMAEVGARASPWCSRTRSPR